MTGTHVCRMAVGRTWIGLPLLLVLAGGCGDAGHTLTPIHGWAEFEQRVLKSTRPVLIEFNKDPCPTCVAQQMELDQVSPDFSDRVLFASMTIMVGMLEVTVPEIRDRYDVKLVPTTILFIDGKEVKRWVLNHPAFEIRADLKKLVGENRPPGPAS